MLNDMYLLRQCFGYLIWYALEVLYVHSQKIIIPLSKAVYVSKESPCSSVLRLHANKILLCQNPIAFDNIVVAHSDKNENRDPLRAMKY